jgi:hypothetical protein
VYQVWAYSAQDLLQVKNGTKQPWEIQPYDVWNYEPPYAASSGHAGGVAYDPASGRIYVAQPYGDGAKPVIYVYQVGAPAPDTTPPVISSIASSGVTSSGATVTWTTNEGSDTQVEYGTTTAYGASTTLNPAMVTSHSAQLSGLAANTLYHYRVRSKDAAGNLAISADRTFTTAAADTQAPVITSIASSGVTSSGATVTWTTNEGSNTQVEYGTTTAYGASTTLNTTMVTSHSAQLSGLAANTLYHYRVKSRDAAGNLATSADGTFTTSAQQTIYSYDNPPPLAPSNPATTVNVSNVSQLIAAINNLQSGQTISLAAGTYNLSGVTDALYVPQGISDWTIRGATGDRDDVVIRGAGMSGSVRFGFWIGNSPRGTIADLTIDGVRDHGVIANIGAHDMLFHNLRIVDSGDQYIKSNPDGSDGNDRGIVEYSVFEYRTTDNNNYTNGVDIHAGDGWIVRYNLFRNFLSPTGQGFAGPAVLAWNGSSNTSVIGNTFIDVARGISLGLIDKAGGFDHQGGLIANNVFARSPTLPQSVDVPIMVADSPNTKIFHNTILNRGSYPNAIEYRFGSTTGLQIRNNLSDSGIQARDGATGTVTGNTTNANLSWFVNVAAGDLHLVSTAPVINQAAVIADVTTDIDGQARGASPDVGADEYGGQTPGDTTPPVISSIATSGVTHNGATVTWTTNEGSDTQVEFGTTTAYGSSTTLNTAMVTSHSAQLSGLAANTLYHYRVKSRDAAGNLSISADRTFTTGVANVAPIAQGDVVTTAQSSPVTINVLANDSDANGDVLSITSFTQPSHGSVALVSGSLRYSPTNGYTGADAFTYTISDGRGGTATATVSITVQQTNPTSVSVVQGRLLVRGDIGNDSVTITGVGNGMTGQYVVVTNQGTQTVSGVVGDFDIDMLGGDDQIIINNAYVNGTIDIDTGTGNDVVTLGSQKPVSTRLTLVVTLGDGNDVLDGKRLYIGTIQSVSGGVGNDRISFIGGALPTEFILGTSSGGATTILGEQGNDQLEVTYSFVVGQLQLNGGVGDDTISIRTSASNSAVSLIGDLGIDSLTADTDYFIATLLLDGGADADQLNVRNSLGITTTTIQGAAGNDTATVNNLTAQRLLMYLGTQNDTCDVRNSVFDELYAALGNEDDTANIFGSRLRLGATLDGGLGRDTLFDRGNLFGAVRRLGFEITG